ncbi:DUF4105 domain-containing protein [Helicobacter sp.]|uniref:Lnb N-terminal periplasmic domain-containing protein n=1 Tax=Helicobacter sp. TaxID=218 RepID=UPI0025C364B7|nr:DUF4105 domain-containing protein [Helicobacter sp.]
MIYHKFFIPLSFVFLLHTNTFAHTQSTEIIIENLIAQAKALNLADSKEWKDLLHIDTHKSEIISPYFFLTPNIKKSKNLAQDELEATIVAFYAPISSIVVPEVIKQKRLRQIIEFEENDIKLPTRSIEPQDYHALCRFPARLNFLSKHLDFVSLPQLECAEFEAMLKYIAPTKASIVFPSAHINSPASMFGHTFLLLDSVFQSRLLAFAINYQADADQNTENPIAFAFNGLFGFYTGSYSNLPYYDKIKEYANVESRDMWEYELNLNPQEITQLYNHIWELSDSFSWYYFFDRNCSYNILWLLEVARPSLQLRHQFIYQVNPPETLFVFQKANLITQIVYRPSKRAKLLSYEKVMSNAQVSLAKSLAKGAKEPEAIAQDSKLPLSAKQYILESAIELSEYRFIKGKLDKEKYTEIAHNLASVRSSLGANTPPFLPIPSNPLEGNQSLRITPMLLVNKQGGGHPALDFRIAYHDLTDNDKGYLKGAQIELMRALGYYDTSKTHNGFTLYELNILSVASIAQMSKFFKPFSYRLETGFNRKFNDEDLHYFAAFGGGFSLNFFNFGYSYYLLEPTFFVNHHRPDFALNQVFGLILQDDNRLKATLEYKLKGYDINHFNHSIDSTLSINLKQNLALLARLSMLKNDLNPSFQPTSMFGVRFYF